MPPKRRSARVAAAAAAAAETESQPGVSRKKLKIKADAATGTELGTSTSTLQPDSSLTSSRGRGRGRGRGRHLPPPPQQQQQHSSTDDAVPGVNINNNDVYPTSTSQVGSVRSTGSASARVQFTSFEVPSKSKSKPIPCIRSHDHGSTAGSLIFTHGAGGGLSAPAMTNFCHGFVLNGSETKTGPGTGTGPVITCFQGNMNLQSRVDMFARVLDYEKKKKQRQQRSDNNKLEGDQGGQQSTATATAEQEHEGEGEEEKSKSKLVVAFGGRSMGARAAVMALASHSQTNDNDNDNDMESSIHLLVLVSYPLIAPNNNVRDQILLDIRPDTKVLFISGDGDSMCDLARLAKVRAKMKAATWLVVVKGADHGMNLKGNGNGGVKLKNKKKATEEVGQETGRIAARWIQRPEDISRDMVIRWDEEHETVVLG